MASLLDRHWAREFHTCLLKRKMLQAAAGNAGGGGLDIDEVFSTYLHTGTGATKSIVNGIDLAGEGGLVWSKGRSSARATG